MLFRSVRPDLTTFDKIIGGGLPVGAYGGRRDVMAMIAPAGPVYQAGTLSGNPLAMAAGIATLEVIDAEPDFYPKLEAASSRIESALRDAAGEAGIAVTINRVGSMITVFFTEHMVIDFDTAKTSDTTRFAKYFRSMLENGIYLAPSQFETCFVSSAHTEADIEKTLAAARQAFEAAARA